MNKSFRLPAYKLAESQDGVSKKIQLFRVGTFYHSEYGKFDITPEILNAMERNFKAGIRGVDIPVNYQHDSESIAAGWMKSVFMSEDGKELWAEVDWTPNGQRVLTDREFRYISPEFTYEYQDNESLKKFGPVLLGAGLTNIPTIKNMEPVVELSEYKATSVEKPKLTEKGVKAMDFESVDVESMSPEQLKALVKDLLAKMTEMKGKSEMAEKQMADMQAEKKMAEKKSAFALMLTEGKVCKAQEEAYLAGDMVKFAELAQPIKLGGEAGNAGQGTSAAKDPQDEVIRLAEIKLNEKSVKTIEEGIRAVLREKSELATKIYG